MKIFIIPDISLYAFPSENTYIRRDSTNFMVCDSGRVGHSTRTWLGIGRHDDNIVVIRTSFFGAT